MMEDANVAPLEVHALDERSTGAVSTASCWRFWANRSRAHADRRPRPWSQLPFHLEDNGGSAHDVAPSALRFQLR